MKTLFFTITILFTVMLKGQTYLEWESYSVEEFYEKIELKSGSLDENGDPIDYIYVTTKIEEGVYEIEIADHIGDLYEIKYTDFFITFISLYGLAGIGEEGVLVIGKSSWSSTFYKKPDDSIW